MRVVARYRRLAKPRGGWRYGLDLDVYVEISDREIDDLVPDWYIQVPWIDLACYAHAQRTSRSKFSNHIRYGNYNNGYVVELIGVTWHCYNGQTIPRWPGQRLYFDSEADRERMIAYAHHLAEGVREAINDWWHKNAATVGDPSEHEVVYELAEKENADAARVIRLL